jgi:chromosome segregation ATPase
MLAEELLTVTSLSRTSTRRQKEPKTISHADFDTTLARDQAALDHVGGLREQIEVKEAEIARLREALERETEIDESKAPEELRRLQAAFDRCQRECHEKLQPVALELHKKTSELRGKQRFLEAMAEIAQERRDASNRLTRATDESTRSLDDPSIVPVDESRFRVIVEEGVKVQTDFDTFHFRSGFDTHSVQQLTKLNEDLQRLLNDAVANEEHSHRRRDTAERDIEVRCARPKVVLIDDDWVSASTRLSHSALVLKELNNGIKMFNDEVGRLGSENRAINDKIAGFREELLSLEKYIPVQGMMGTDLRFEITGLAMENERLEAKIRVVQAKLKINREQLATLRNRLEKIPSHVETMKAELDATKRNRQQAEEQLQLVQTIAADLMSQKVFTIDERETLAKRVAEGKQNLQQIREQTRKYKLILKKQKLMISLADEMMALRKMNLQKVAGTVETLLKINAEINKSGDK